jgi:DNA end-binding protein Ku
VHREEVDMARSIWTGVISFGLVSVPVRLHPATRPHEVSFHQFEKGTGDRIRYQRVNERTGDEVDYADIVKGAEVGDGEYVMIEPEELDSIAPGRSRSLDIHTFVDLTEIDPIYYEKTYYLAPASDETAKTYALLRDAMAKTNRAAIGTLVMRGKEYLAAIRPDDGLLLLETMYFADEIRDPRTELDRVPGRTKARPQEVRMAEQLIESMTERWNPKAYRDTYTDRVKKLIAAKKKGKEITVAEEPPRPTNVIDLMEVLKASVDAARGGRRKAGSAAGGGRRGPARKTTTRSTAPDLAALTKAELASLARELDVPGRSSMTRPQLEKAVTAAQRRAA